MVQFCPKCGTQAPDDDAVFCNKCGTRLPPVIPEKQDIFCQRCGTKAPDDQSAFCNKCGSPIQSISPAQIQIAGIRQAAAAARPVMKKASCPSCDAPLVDEISDYCNVCGADVRRPAPVPPARETSPPAPERTRTVPPVPVRDTIQPSPVKTGPVTPAGDVPDAGKDVPEQRKNRGPLLKWGLIALVAVIFLVVVVSFVPGMLSGTNQTAETTPAPTPDHKDPVTTVPTRKTTQTTAPAVTPSPTKKQNSTDPAMALIMNATGTMNVSTTVTANVSANVTAKVTPAVTKPLSNIDASKPFSIGETATDGKGKLTLNGYSIKNKLGDPIPSYAIGKKYLILNITYENLQQNKTADVDLKGMTVKDTGGFTFDQITDDAMLENPFYLNGKTVPPLENRTGNMAFVINPDATFLKFEYNFGDQKNAVFQLPQYL
jgi:hypothetical protein